MNKDLLSFARREVDQRCGDCKRLQHILPLGDDGVIRVWELSPQTQAEAQAEAQVMAQRRAEAQLQAEIEAKNKSQCILQ